MLMYASMATWPDITYATNKLSQFNADPSPMDSLTTSLPLPKENEGLRRHSWRPRRVDTPRLHRFRQRCMSRHSSFDFIIYVHSRLWLHFLELKTATSSYDFDMRGRICRKLSCDEGGNYFELLGRPEPTTIIHSNNAGSISLTKDVTFHARSKHIDVQFHYTRKRVTAKDVLFKYLPMADMPTL